MTGTRRIRARIFVSLRGAASRPTRGRVRLGIELCEDRNAPGNLWSLADPFGDPAFTTFRQPSWEASAAGAPGGTDLGGGDPSAAPEPTITGVSGGLPAETAPPASDLDLDAVQQNTPPLFGLVIANSVPSPPTGGVDGQPPPVTPSGSFGNAATSSGGVSAGEPPALPPGGGNSPPGGVPSGNPPALPMPAAPPETLDGLDWPEGSSSANGERSYERHAVTTTLQVGNVTYILGAVIQAYTLGDFSPSDAGLVRVRGTARAVFSFSKSTDGAVVEHPEDKITSWTLGDGAAPPGDLTTYSGLVPAGLPWSRVEVSQSDTQLAKGVVNQRGIEYAYQSADQSHAVTVSMLGAGVADGESTSTVTVRGGYSNDFHARDWLPHENGPRQGTMIADVTASGTFSQNQTGVTTFAGGVAVAGHVSGNGRSDGRFDTSVQSIESNDTEIDQSNFADRSLQWTVELSGTTHGESAVDETYAKSVGEADWLLTDGTATAKANDSTRVVRDETVLDVKFGSRTPDGWESHKGGNTVTVATAAGELNSESDWERETDDQVLMRDTLRDKSKFERDESAGLTGHDRYAVSRYDSAAGKVTAAGKNSYGSESRSHRVDASDTTYDFLHDAATDVTTWAETGGASRSVRDNGTVDYPSASATTVYGSLTSLAGPTSSSGKVTADYKFNPALAAVAGAAAAVTAKTQTDSQSSASLLGLISDDSFTFGPNRISVTAANRTDYDDGDNVTTRKVTALKAENGEPESGVIETVATLKGRDTSSKTGKGKLSFFGSAWNGVDGFEFGLLRVEDTDLTERSAGSVTKGTQTRTQTYESGFEIEDIDSDRDWKSEYTKSGKFEINDLVNKTVTTTTYQPNLVVEGNPASATSHHTEHLDRRAVEGELVSGDWTGVTEGEVDHKVVGTSRHDLSATGFRIGHENGDYTVRYKSDLDERSDQSVEAGSWNGSRTNYNNFERVTTDAVYEFFVSDKVAANASAPYLPRGPIWLPSDGGAGGSLDGAYSEVEKYNSEDHRSRSRWRVGSSGRGGDKIREQETTKRQGVMDYRDVFDDSAQWSDRKSHEDWLYEGDRRYRPAAGGGRELYYDERKVERHTEEGRRYGSKATPGGATPRWFNGYYIFTSTSEGESLTDLEGSPPSPGSRGWAVRYGVDEGSEQSSYDPTGQFYHNTWGSRLRDSWGGGIERPVPEWLVGTWALGAYELLSDSWVGRRADWVYDHGRDLGRIVFGAVDVVGGVLMSETGLGAIAGIPLAAVGVDQVITGARNIAYGKRDRAGVEELVYAATGSETAAVLLPAAATLSLWAIGPRLARAGVRAGMGTSQVGNLSQQSVGRAGSAASGDLQALTTYAESVINNPVAARLHRRLIEGGYRHVLDFGNLQRIGDDLVLFGEHTRVPRQVTIFARAHRDITAMLGTFGHEARHAVDALRRLPLGTRWSEFRAHLQEFTLRTGRFPTAMESRDLAAQVLQNYRGLVAHYMDDLLRQIAANGHGF